jgi:hypothetical protein
MNGLALAVLALAAAVLLAWALACESSDDDDDNDIQADDDDNDVAGDDNDNNDNDDDTGPYTCEQVADQLHNVCQLGTDLSPDFVVWCELSEDLRMKVTGTQVNDQHGDGGDCLAWSPSFPNGKARVYYMWMYEDDARDDQDGPDSGIETL